jgi:hypothetical protein
MNDSTSRLAVLKRAKPIIRDSVLMTKAPKIHPLVEKTARAISDWHSEVDWQLHEDKAIRSLEVVAEYLRREGYRDASDFIHSTVWREPLNRKRLDAAV